MTTIDHSKINAGAIEIVQTLQDNGHSSYLVGGCVRDLLLGTEPKDWDITTSAVPAEVKKIFKFTYDTGIEHGTVSVRLNKELTLEEVSKGSPFPPPDLFEITTFRTEGKYEDGRRPTEVSFVKTVEEDLSRRDFTINAIAYDPIAKNLIDPFGGQEDLVLGVIRAVGNAEERFKEDGLRIMRAARFAARYGYAIDEDTLSGMSRSLDTLTLVSKERVSEEIRKTLMTAYPGVGIRMLFHTGALSVALPEMTKSLPYSHFAAYHDSYLGDMETRLAGLFSNMPVNLIQQEMKDLKFSNKEIKRVSFLIGMLDEYIELVKHPKILYAKFIAAFKNSAPDDWESTYEQFKFLLKSINLSLDILNSESPARVISRRELSLNGNDLLELGVSSGPQIKKVLDYLYDSVLMAPELNDKLKLISLAKSNNLL